jgi:hypothetical protein
MFQNGDTVLHLMVSQSIPTTCTQVCVMLQSTHSVYGRVNGEFCSRCHHIHWINKKMIVAATMSLHNFICENDVLDEDFKRCD